MAKPVLFKGKPYNAGITMDIGALEKIALTAHQSGDLAQAKEMYNKILSCNPNKTSALHYIAISSALENNLARAVALLKKAAILEPKNPDIARDYATVLLKTKKHEKALRYFDKAVELNPCDPEIYSRRGVALTELEKYDDALKSFERCLELNPDNWEALINRAKVFESLKRYQKAVDTCEAALKINPNAYAAFFCMGNAFLKLDKFESALESFNRALLLDSASFDAWLNKAAALKYLKCYDEAMQIYQSLLARDPDSAELNNSIGIIYLQKNCRKDAIRHFDIAVRQKNHDADMAVNFARCLLDYHDFDGAINFFDKAHRNKPTEIEYIQPLVFELNYSEKTTPEELRSRSKKLGAILRSRKTKNFSLRACIENEIKLKIGMIGGDFKNHPVGCFLEDFLNQALGKGLEFTLYSNNDLNDETTERLKALDLRWVDIRDCTDAKVASEIYASKIDILIDLSGHTAFNRLGVFTYRAAPIQVSWLGYCGTTGLEEMDYVLGDPYVTPVADEKHFVEKIWRLPTTYWCFTPPPFSVRISGLPAVENGFVTYGCFNNSKKINNKVVEVWSKILDLNIHSKLLLKSSQYEDEDIKRHFLTRFAAAGIAPQRIIFEGRSSRPDYFEAYNRVDIVLDPFPYPGGTTSFEGLWMGAPFVTLKGNRFYAHNGETIAHNGGLSEWIAESEEDYIKKAVGFSERIEWLSDLRAGLREKVLTSRLFNGSAFARDFEEAMWMMWRERLSQERKKKN